jgi:hypothetical protein
MRKAEFYSRRTGVKADRMIIVTPHADERTLKTAEEFGIEIYTRVRGPSFLVLLMQSIGST